MSEDNKRLNEVFVELIRDKKISSQIRLKKAQYLVKLGADVNAKLYGKSALSWAEEMGDNDVIKYLKQSGGKSWVISEAEVKKLGEELIEAVNTGKAKEDIEALIKKGADVEAKDNMERTPLMLASREGLGEIVDLLIKRGVQIDARDSRGWTALMFASSAGRDSLIDKLIVKGANVNAMADNNSTALMLASYWGKENAVVKLIEKEADLSVKNNDGRTALDNASLKGHKRVEEILRKAQKEKRSKFWKQFLTGKTRL